MTGAVYLQAFRVWLDDDTPDMARTLAELDRRLQQAETAARWFAGFGRFCPTRGQGPGSGVKTTMCP